MKILNFNNYKNSNTNRNVNVITGLIATFFTAILSLFLFKPALDPTHIDFYLYISIVLLSISVTIISNFSKMLASIISIFCIIFMFSGASIIKVATSPIFFSKTYQNLIGEVKDGDFKEDLKVENLEDIRLVDKEMALAIATKKLGESPATIGSISKVGNIQIQTINGELYWVAPLLHKDTIKSIMNFNEGTSGYVMVSATNPQDSKLVQEVNGEPVRIKYQPEGFLTNQLDIHTYFINGVINKAYFDWTFELDEEGVPYWVATTYKNKLIGNDDTAQATGVIVLNANTGELQQYSIKDAPKWVDRIQPDFLIKQQIDYWGKYVNGFLNSVITEDNVLLSTDGISLVFGEEGRAYWYTGLTSSGSDDSTIGFILVDSKTKDATIYKQPGGTETAAMISAQNKVSNFAGYRSSFPIMYNIFGEPTYVSSIKDSSDLLKKVAFVSAEDVSIVAVGDTKEEAYKNYKEALSKSGKNLSSLVAETQIITGKITRINTITNDNKTNIYFTLDNDNTIFKSSLNRSDVYLSKVGDNVKVKIEKDNKDKEVEILDFKNNTLK